MTTQTITLPHLHAGQAAVRRSSARFRVLSCGRRWGKTRLGGLLCVTTAVIGKRAWWVAPSYPISNVGWREVTQLAKQIPGVAIHESDRLVTFPSGGFVQVRSADNPDSLRGEGLDFVVIDEAAFVKESAWLESLRPALSDRQGRAMIVSTPKGRNWFWRIWQQGQDDGRPDIESWQFPTASNPYIPPVEIDAARTSLPERVFSQEYEATFLEDGGGVFRGVLDVAIAPPQSVALRGHEYVIGCDWGRSGDFTVFAVVDVTSGECCVVDRSNRIEYVQQRGRLRALAERFMPRAIVAETNAMGEPIIEELQRDGLPIVPFTTTNATKSIAIDNLALAFERAALRVLPDPVLIAELQAYESERLPSGLIRYSAPEGMHDDTVMALALAWSALGGGSWAW